MTERTRETKDREKSAKRALEVLVSLKKTCESADHIIAVDTAVEDALFLRKIKNTPHCEKIPIIIISLPFEIDALFNILAETFKS